MASRPTIFSDVVFRRGLKPEDAATGGLAFVLSANRAVASAFKQYVERIAGIQLPPLVMFEAQVAQQGMERPDIVASTDNGRQLLFIENKFWSGLTENQPVPYLKALIRHRGAADAAALVFVCPERSTAMYWDELHRRLMNDRELGLMGAAPEVDSGASPLVRRLDDRLALVVVPWFRLLELLSRAAGDVGDKGLLEDVAQLRGLVERVDEEQAFLPFRSEELGAEFGIRWRLYTTIPGLVRGKLVREPYGMGYRQNSSMVGLGGSRKWEAWIDTHLDLWGRYGMTPFWLMVWRSLPYYEFTKRVLHTWLTDSPPRAFECKLYNQDHLCVPLVPPLGVGKDTVVEDLARQVAALRDAMERAEGVPQMAEATQQHQPPDALSETAPADSMSGTSVQSGWPPEEGEVAGTQEHNPIHGE